MHKDVLFDSEILLTLFTNISVVLFIILYSPLAAANQAAILLTISFISMLNEIIFQLLSSVQMLYNFYGNLMIKRNCNTVFGGSRRVYIKEKYLHVIVVRFSSL